MNYNQILTTMKKVSKLPEKMALALSASALIMSSGFVMSPQPSSHSTSYSILQGTTNLPEVSMTDCLIPGTRCFILPTVTIKP